MLTFHRLTARQWLRSYLFEAARASSPDYSPEGIEAHLFLVGLFVNNMTVYRCRLLRPMKSFRRPVLSILVLFFLANLQVPNKLLAPTGEEDMPINNTNAFYEVHKGLNLDRSHWYTLIEGQNGRFVIYEYDDYKVAANEAEGCEMIPLETFLMDGKFDATAQLKLRRLLEDEVIQEETA